eukprot:scaffold118346_cov27-Prasinocladus_malaysianus.AAC.1
MFGLNTLPGWWGSVQGVAAERDLLAAAVRETGSSLSDLSSALRVADAQLEVLTDRKPCGTVGCCPGGAGEDHGSREGSQTGVREVSRGQRPQGSAAQARARGQLQSVRHALWHTSQSICRFFLSLNRALTETSVPACQALKLETER